MSTALAPLPLIFGTPLLIWGLLDVFDNLLGFRDKNAPPRECRYAVRSIIGGLMWIATTYFLQRQDNSLVAAGLFAAGLLTTSIFLRA